VNNELEIMWGEVIVVMSQHLRVCTEKK